MSDPSRPISEEELAAYADGLLSLSEREAFEQRLRAQPEVAVELELDERVSAALRRQFPAAAPSDAHLQRMLAGPAPVFTRRFAQVAVLAAAAALCGVIAAWQFLDRPKNVPFFAPQPVAELYREEIAKGFEPYYECRDDERFAATFKQRQGITLHLAAMPAGKGMLGLSYPGGLSRDTTAMLCQVDGEPVMVFVDRVENDQPIAGENDDPALRITREVRDGLVFYEIAPVGTSSVLEYLVREKPAKPQAEL